MALLGLVAHHCRRVLQNVGLCQVPNIFTTCKHVCRRHRPSSQRWQRPTKNEGRRATNDKRLPVGPTANVDCVLGEHRRGVEMGQSMFHLHFNCARPRPPCRRARAPVVYGLLASACLGGTTPPQRSQRHRACRGVRKTTEVHVDIRGARGVFPRKVAAAALPKRSPNAGGLVPFRRGTLSEPVACCCG